MPFGGLDRDDAMVGQDRRLPDIEGRQRRQQREALRDHGLLRRRRRLRPSGPSGAVSLRRDIGRAVDAEALLLEEA